MALVDLWAFVVPILPAPLVIFVPFAVYPLPSSPSRLGMRRARFVVEMVIDLGELPLLVAQIELNWQCTGASTTSQEASTGLDRQ